MQFFFISGSPDSGKTTMVRAVCDWLCSAKGYSYECVNSDGQEYAPLSTFPEIGTVKDFSCILNKNQKTVLVHSATDNGYNIDLLDGYIKKYNPDVVISSCRDFCDWPRTNLCDVLGIVNDEDLCSRNKNVMEFPLAKVTRRTKIVERQRWYLTNIFRYIKEILAKSPYDL